MIELKMRGFTNAAASLRMREEGYMKVCEKTISTFWQTMKRVSPYQIVEELQRQQLADITMSEDREVRLKYRDRLLDKLMPQRIESRSEAETTLVLKMWRPDENPQRGDNLPAP
jgi:hypothetical protein